MRLRRFAFLALALSLLVLPVSGSAMGIPHGIRARVEVAPLPISWWIRFEGFLRGILTPDRSIDTRSAGGETQGGRVHSQGNIGMDPDGGG